jgi:hypothetical protein
LVAPRALTLAAGTVEITIPPGARCGPTSISVTNRKGPADAFTPVAAMKYALAPVGFAFDEPVTIRLAWADADADDEIDDGVCSDGRTTRDQQADCAGSCVGGSATPEADSKLRRDGDRFTKDGFFPVAQNDASIQGRVAGRQTSSRRSASRIPAAPVVAARAAAACRAGRGRAPSGEPRPERARCRDRRSPPEA